MMSRLYYLLTYKVITDAPWFVPNTVIQRDLQVTTVKQEARKCSINYRKRLDVYPNRLANTLFLEQLVPRRLKRLYHGDLAINGQLSTPYPRDHTNPYD
jgi:hypothetical protein